MKKMEADVVVIGSGPSGLAAAAQAAENGAKVVVFEKANVSGGAANMGMGPLGIGTRYQKDMMVEAEVEQLFKEFMDYTHWRSDARLVKRYFESSADTIAWLEDTCGVQFAGAYKYFPKSHATWHIVAVNGGIGRNGGAIMNKAIRDHAVANGAKFLMETPAKKILMEDGKVAGAVGTDASGEEVEVRCKAVVVATGGCGDNPQMIKERTGYTYRGDMYNFAIPGLKGDGINMVAEAGGGTTAMNVEMMYLLPESDMGPDCIPAVFMQPNLLVNKLGKRFMNEEQMQNTTFTGNAISFQKDAVAFSIIDSRIARQYMKKGVDVVNFVHHPDNVADFEEVVDAQIANGITDIVKADTLEELAGKLGIKDVDTFIETVDEYNDMCESRDSLFYKPARFLKPIGKGPFYAGIFHPGGYGTLGGIKVDETMQVLTQDWDPVPGLYAAGTDTCTIYGDSYMFLIPGNTMGYCVNTGRFAGEAAAAYAEEN
ncbi:MAG: FAD-dependent oxidoreductase [Oscillospiraceae bacterium]|nr:FAD-dependent oxidoreductase [Oscillospiraceae bacterium]